jgi:DNA-binding MarR family transcriptional regulator
MSVFTEEIALEMMETVPMVMRVMREDMRRYRQPHLSVPQFRALAYSRNQPGTSLNCLAEHLGLTPASTSKLVDGLVARDLIERRESVEDRRRVTLNLTPLGFSVWEQAFHHTQDALARRLSGLTETDREILKASMRVLRPLFEEAAGSKGEACK